MKNKFAIYAAALILSAATVSCGHDRSDENTVPELPVISTAAPEAETTEAAAEKTTSAETKNTTEEASTQDEAKKTDQTTTTKADEKNDGDGNTDQSSEPEPEPDPEPDDTPQTPSSQEIRFGFDKLDSSAEDVISALGDPIDVTSAPACFSNGADSKIYTYENIRVECYVLNGEEKICAVTITGGDYSTDENIKIGSSQADVENAYGNGETAGEYTIYYNGDKELDVKYDNGSVCELMFYMSV